MLLKYILSEKQPVNVNEIDLCRIKVILKVPTEIFELYNVLNYRGDFELLCKLYTKDNINILLFRNTDVITGSTMYYFFDDKNFIVYKTGWLIACCYPALLKSTKMDLTN